MDQIIQFLSHFGTPLVVAQHEGQGGKKKGFDWSKVWGLDILLEINREFPYRLAFTANGNYGQSYKEGDKYTFTKESINKRKPPYNAIYIDVDTKSYGKSKEELMQIILPEKPTYVVETPGGYHVYFIIKEEEREIVRKDFGESFWFASKHIRDSLYGDEDAVGSKSFGSLARLPLSYHRKKGDPVLTTIVYENLDNQLTADDINFHITMAMESESIKKEERKVRSSWGSGVSKSMGDVTFEKVFKALELYPKEIGKKQCIFVLNGNSIGIKDIKTGEIIPTDGYKVANGYVNNFSKTKHPISERPRGPVYSFLKNYFGSELLCSKFLKKEFGIMLGVDNYEFEEKVLTQYQKTDYIITMTNKRVILEREVMGAEGQKIVKKDLFRVPINIVSKTQNNTSKNGYFSDQPFPVYVVDNGGSILLMKRMIGKREFNKAYGNQYFFYGEDNDLGMLYEALDYKENLPYEDVIVESGYYEIDNTHFVVLGGNVVRKSNKAIDDPKIVSSTKFQTQNGEQCTVAEYLEIFRQAFTDDIAVPTLLGAVGLAGMNIREGLGVYPGLFITGGTGSGKTTIANYIKMALGYKDSERKIGLGLLTPQPIIEAASDPAILHLDELTNKINPIVEERLRNIVNRDSGGRGSLEENLKYSFKSPLLVTGERTFKDESLNNRFVAVAINKQHQRKGGKAHMERLAQLSIIDDVYSTYCENKNHIMTMMKDHIAALSKEYPSRIAETRAVVFTINDLFHLNMDIKPLMEKQLSTMGLETVEQPPLAKLEHLLMKGLHNRKIVLKVKELTKQKDGVAGEIYMFNIMDDEYYQTNRVAIQQACYFANEEARGKVDIEKLSGFKDRVIANQLGINITFMQTRAIEDVDGPISALCESLAKQFNHVTVYR